MTKQPLSHERLVRPVDIPPGQAGHALDRLFLGRDEDLRRAGPGYPDVAVRFTDSKVGQAIVLDPRLAAGEAFDERVFRLWAFYLSGSTAAFESGGLSNYQIQFARDRHALPLSHGYIEDEERRLLGA